MVPRGNAPLDAAERRFLLASGPDEEPRLLPAEAQHARVVLRLRPGDRLVGLDGRGRTVPLEVVLADARRLEVKATGPAQIEPEPGEVGAFLPWIEVAAVLPKGARAEEMVVRLVQLGAAALVPLVTERTAPEARADGAGRRERLARVAAESCKQSGRAWSLELGPVCPLDALLESRAAARCAVLDPRASATLSAWLASNDHTLRPWRATRASPLTLVVGPEGGFTPDEERAFDARRVARARIAPHALRIETAAEAAVAIVVERCLA
jgi:16S rRNA (uracil1498-N3)-methyltransferase